MPPVLDSPNITVTVDNSPPTVPIVTDDGVYTNSLNTLHAVWTASSDPHSGIKEYQYTIGTTQGGTAFDSSVYPPAQSDTYVKATSTYPRVMGLEWDPWLATDPTKSIVGPGDRNSWVSDYTYSSNVNQRFHIDLGSAKVIRRIYYVNFHMAGGNTEQGIKNFTFWGSNTAGSFAELTYGTDTGWTQLTTSQSTFDQHIGSDVPDRKYITVTNSTAYRYYAFKIADSWQDYSVGVRRIELQTSEVEIPWTSTGLSTEITRTGLSLNEGQAYYISVKAINNANLSSIGYSDGITLDSMAPSGWVVINNDDNYTRSRTVILRLPVADEVSGVSQMQLSNDGTSWSDPEAYTASKSWDLTSDDGIKTVYAKFIDGAGNISAPATGTIRLDTTPPVVAIVAPDNGFTSSAQTITVSGTIDDDYATVIVNGITATVSEGLFSAKSITLSQGPNTITATATDPAGNTSSRSITVAYQSNIPLSISITLPANNANVNTSTIDVSGTVTDNTAAVTINGTTATVSNNTFTALNVPLTDGANSIIAEATTGTQTAEDSVNVILTTVGSGWQVIENTYDSRDRLVITKEYLPGSNPITTTFHYDAAGNKDKQTDPNGNMTTYTYDARNLLFKTRDAEGNQTFTYHDMNGKLSTIIDAKGAVTTYQYDVSGWLTKTTYPDSSFEEYTPDSNSNIATKRTRKDELITYSYDNLNRMTSKACPSYPTVTYTYDIASRLTVVSDSNYSITYSYDALNRTVQAGYPGSKTVSYQYDKSSKRLKLTYPDGSYITYEYDELSRLQLIKDQNDQMISQYNYDSLSRRLSLDYQNNTQTTYLYDDLGRLLNKINKQAAGPVISSFAYTYDAASNRLTMTTLQGTHNYGYDNIYRVNSVSYPTGYPFSGVSYDYDRVGNRTQVSGDNVETYSSNSLNQYTQINAINYSYDGNGNLTNDGTFTYAYDYENRLISATTAAMTAIYTYDPAGRRVEKSVNGYITCYIYDGDQIIAEYDATGSLTKKFVYGPGIDEPILMDNITNKYYYHFDGLGSVTEITDSSANIVEKYFYDIFGKTIIKDANDNVLAQSAIGNPYFFTARALDPETGLYYYRARYYNPLIGRFLQTDPVGYKAGMNLYTYCNNNPINFNDPRGLCPEIKEELKKKMDDLENAMKDKDKEAIKKAAFALKQYLQIVGLLDMTGKALFSTFSLIMGDAGPLEQVGNLIGGLVGFRAGTQLGVAALTIPGVAGEMPFLPVWTGVAGAYLGSEYLGEKGKVADEFYGFHKLGVAY